MLKKPIIILVLFLTTLLCFVGGYFTVSFYVENKAKDHSRVRQEKVITRHLEKWNVLSREESKRIFAIEDAKGNVSEEDLQFVLNFLKAPNSVDPAKTMRKQGAITTLVVLTEEDRLEEKQNREVYQAILPLLDPKEKSASDLILLYGMREVRALNDKRLVTCVLPLLEHPNPSVKKSAEKTVSKLGYKF